MFLPIWFIVLAFGLTLVAGLTTWRTILRMRRGAATFRAVAEGSSDGLVLMEQDSRIIWANAAYCRTMGYPLEKLLGQYPLEFALPPGEAWSPEDARAFRFDPKEERFGKLTRVQNIRGNGEEFMHEFSHAVVRTGHKTRFLLAGRDITERMEREKDLIAAKEKLRLLSHQDSLTGLSNRHCLAQTLASFAASGEPFAVLQIDMNDFKAVNDTYGHSAGDALLVHFSQVLQSLAEEDWHCARVGGDEFTVLVPGVWALGVALAHANRVFHDSQVPMAWQSGELVPSVSVGAAVFSGQGQSPQDVLACADIALYAAKERLPERIAGYDDEMHRQDQAKQALHRDFSEALGNGDIVFELQPVVEVSKHKLLRFDLRPVWDHRHHGRLHDRELHDIARQLCQIDGLEHRVIQCARDCLSRLRANGLADIGVGLSLSEGVLTGNCGRDDLAWLTDNDRAEANSISFAFPGDCLRQSRERSEIVPALKRLSDAGARIYMDNLGMDVSWVLNVSDVPVDGLVIHRELIEAVDTEKAALALIMAGASLAKEMNHDVVIQGVARNAQIQALLDIGCTEMSGPALAPPMSLEAALDWLKNDWPRWSHASDKVISDLSA